jgi:hypothetical protein
MPLARRHIWINKASCTTGAHGNRRHKTKSAAVREALKDKLRASANEPSVYDLVKASVGSIDSGIRDLGHNPNHLSGFGLK